MERYNDGRARGDAADIDAVVIFITAAVFFIDNGDDVALRRVDLQALPVLFAALAVDKDGIAVFDRDLVVFGLGGDLVLKAEIGAPRHRQLERAGRVGFSCVAAHQHVLAVEGRDLPLVCAVRCAGLGLRDQWQTVKEIVKRLRRGHGAERKQSNRQHERQQKGQNAFFHAHGLLPFRRAFARII